MVLPFIEVCALSSCVMSEFLNHVESRIIESRSHIYECVAQFGHNNKRDIKYRCLSCEVK